MKIEINLFINCAITKTSTKIIKTKILWTCKVWYKSVFFSKTVASCFRLSVLFLRLLEEWGLVTSNFFFHFLFVFFSFFHIIYIFSSRFFCKFQKFSIRLFLVSRSPFIRSLWGKDNYPHMLMILDLMEPRLKIALSTIALHISKTIGYLSPVTLVPHCSRLHSVKGRRTQIGRLYYLCLPAAHFLSSPSYVGNFRHLTHLNPSLPPLQQSLPKTAPIFNTSDHWQPQRGHMTDLNRKASWRYLWTLKKTCGTELDGIKAKNLKTSTRY